MDMIMHCRNLTFNGYSDWRLSDVEETIYVCMSGMAPCNGGYETSFLQAGFGGIYTIKVIYNSGSVSLNYGGVYTSRYTRTFICVR